MKGDTTVRAQHHIHTACLLSVFDMFQQYVFAVASFSLSSLSSQSLFQSNAAYLLGVVLHEGPNKVDEVCFTVVCFLLFGLHCFCSTLEAACFHPHQLRTL